MYSHLKHRGLQRAVQLLLAKLRRHWYIVKRLMRKDYPECSFTFRRGSNICFGCLKGLADAEVGFMYQYWHERDALIKLY